MKAVLTTVAVLGLAAGCLARPVVNENPTTKTVVFEQLKQQSIDKVDLLFAIDNSSSMGDKQDLLAAAVPVLVNRLLDPNCIAADARTCKVSGDCAGLGASAQCDAAGNAGSGQCFVPGDGQGCKSRPNTKPEFPAVHDMHVALVSSSLGGGGSPDVCIDSPQNGPHQDDRGHLLNRVIGTPETSIANANPTNGDGGNFLAWLPASDPKNTGKTPPNVTPYSDGQGPQLVGDFQKLVEGVQQHGCGLEAQLESWYRFLIQPDPWDSIALTNDSIPKAQLVGVDATLLKMRHDFLRPDSLVAIIQLTDEEDSWSDPLWAGGYGWTARTFNFPNGPGGGAGPRGTSECDKPGGANNPDCTSCAFAGGKKPVSHDAISDDPNCNACAGGQASCPLKGWWTPTTSSPPIQAADGINVRYSYQTMRTKYGFDSQHNVQRYIDGLREMRVPDRNNEAHDYQRYATDTQRNCTNPLFAASLPDGSDTSPEALCALKPGNRTPDRVFYAIIGGVPNRLVDGANGPDWKSMLGNDPEHYDFSGIDPHMVESVSPRATLEAPPLSTGTYNLGSDPDSGREWNTLTSTGFIDLQYACTFDLPTQKNCLDASNKGACDCADAASTAPDGPPLCASSNGSQARTTQVKGKAYPTIRELRVAKGLGAQAVVASLCAKVVSGSTADPSYGYNPAMRTIANKLSTVLASGCLPQKLTRASDGTVPCQALIVYPNQTNQAAGCNDPGMSQPSAAVLKRFDDAYIAGLGDAGNGNGSTPPVVCVFDQLSTCAPASTGATQPGWCYVEGVANTGGICPQAIEFAASGPPSGTLVELECIEGQ